MFFGGIFWVVIDQSASKALHLPAIISILGDNTFEFKESSNSNWPLTLDNFKMEDNFLMGSGCREIEE